MTRYNLAQELEVVRVEWHCGHLINVYPRIENMKGKPHQLPYRGLPARRPCTSYACDTIGPLLCPYAIVSLTPSSFMAGVPLIIRRDIPPQCLAVNIKAIFQL